MKKIKIGTSELVGSNIVLGCMRINEMNENEITKLITTAVDGGINFFDHADIYAGGESEKIFAKGLKLSSVKREDIIIQTKCGINNKDDKNIFFDFSKEHIIDSVENSLKRLDTDYIDILLLHRPDTLMEGEEVASAFKSLKKSGKVRYFGVSNQKPMQIEYLNKYVDDPLIINQLQLSITNTGMIDSGLNVNMKVNSGIDRDGSVLEYCRLNNITIQAWSPFQYGFFEGVFIGSDKYPELNELLTKISKEKGITENALAVAWISRHPAKIQTVLGTTNSDRVKSICEGGNVELSRSEWYSIYKAVGNILP